MTSTTSTASTSIDRPVAPLALATFLGTAAFTALGVYGDGSEGSPGSLGELLTILALTAVAVAIVFGLVVPRNQQSSRAATVGLVLSVVGLLLVVAFWSGLTPALAVGGIVLGAAARRSNLRPTTGSIAMAVGALALVGYVAIYVTDWMATNNIAGM